MDLVQQVFKMRVRSKLNNNVFGIVKERKEEYWSGSRPNGDLKFREKDIYRVRLFPNDVEDVKDFVNNFDFSRINFSGRDLSTVKRNLLLGKLAELGFSRALEVNGLVSKHDLGYIFFDGGPDDGDFIIGSKRIDVKATTVAGRFLHVNKVAIDKRRELGLPEIDYYVSTTVDIRNYKTYGFVDVIIHGFISSENLLTKGQHWLNKSNKNLIERTKTTVFDLSDLIEELKEEVSD